MEHRPFPTIPLTSTQSSGTNITTITGTATSLLLNAASSATYLTDSSSYAATVSNSNVTWGASGPAIANTSAVYYRARNTYDITQLPTQYDADDIVNNPNAGGLVVGRPWYSPFTTYEQFATPGATITTTQNGPFKITVRSTSYDTEPFVNGQISINDVLVVDTNGRGHTVLALTPTGTVIEQTRFDTWDGPGIDNMNTALLGYATSTVIAICTYDATSLNATVRATLNTYYGGTLTDTWGSVIPRYSHIFIGVKI